MYLGSIVTPYFCWMSEDLRDLFGNPFYPITLDPIWLTPKVVAFALEVYASRPFNPLPIQGKALEKAGCKLPEIFTHCRGPGPQVKGCWVAD